jgi:hypothetical protein
MAFVSGMMGPYESDAHWCFNCHDIIPVCRFDRYPYLGYHLLQEKDDQKHRCRRLETSQVYKIYNRLERPLLESSMKEYLWE